MLASTAAYDLLSRLGQLPYSTAAERKIAQTAFFLDVANLRKDCKESKLKEAEKQGKEKDLTIAVQGATIKTQEGTITGLTD